MIRFELPLKTESVNQQLRQGWRARAARAKKHKAAIALACPKWTAGPLLVVRLTRVSRGTLDDDGLVGALKHVRDGVAARLGLDDGSALVRFEYAQEKGEPAVRVEVQRVATAATLATTD